MSTETAIVTTTRDGDRRATDSEVVTVDQVTGQEFARYPVAGPEEVADAVATARSAAGAWWDLGFSGRAARLRAWRRDIAVGGEELAALIHLENGKPVEDGRAEVLSALGHLTFVLDNVERVLGRRDVTVPPTTANQKAWVEYLPYGVVGVIGPWNFPLGTPGAIVIHALAAGNAVILKPSPVTPGVGEWLARSWERAVPDLPRVFQNLVGFAATGEALTAAGVDKIAFTGSVRSGRAVAAACAPSLTPMLLELGGNDGVVIAEDADLDLAATHVTWGALQNTGLGCISLEVAYVVESVHDALVEKITALARRVHAGSGDGDQIGPVPLPSQIPAIRSHIEDALDRGATAAVGGPASATDGRYLQPTVLVDVPPDALAATEETFGPVLSVVKVRDVDEAVARINAGPYGLGSAVFSRDHGEAIAARLRVGMTSVNDALAFSMVAGLPFGGRGDSGYGRKHGDEGLLEFAYPHAITATTGPAQLPLSSFDRPPGALTKALAGMRDRFAEDDQPGAGNDRTVTDVAEAPTRTEDQIAQILDGFAQAFSFQPRSPLLHSPSEHGLAFEEVTFPSRDGVPLEGWFIPAAGSDKLVIANHPMGFTRSGLPTHLEPWRSAWAASGNGFEVDLVPDYKILHDAGYNVLAYDLRNHGFSGAANGGISSSGIFEARDVAGSLDYARRRTGDMAVGLFSRCLGCSSTFAAMTQFPEVFDGVRCLLGPQPVTARTIIERRLETTGLADRIDDLERRIVLRTGIDFARRSPQEWAKSVRVPTFLYQVRDDVLTDPGDVQTMFDNIPVTDKKLQWIEGTTRRWDGYLEFQRRPDPMLDWLASHMS